ncbi:hypothetical protein [Nocardiopsis trehalosi]|uniref:hypothetical protein n=1 Tax=Nocardiopsis trehalosi TaxID=109329 RepID=UPI00082E079C|nr:hypothetical protein [Nocardiopsis trehalosi]
MIRLSGTGVVGAIAGLWAFAARPLRIVMHVSGLDIDERTIRWSDLARVDLVGDAPGARPVLWPRDREADLPGTAFHGGTAVCSARQVGTGQGHEAGRSRAALSVFAAGVESPPLL